MRADVVTGRSLFPVVPPEALQATRVHRRLAVGAAEAVRPSPFLFPSDMRSLLVLAVFVAAPVVLAPAALAQATPSNADVAAYDAGYQTAVQLREGSATFTAARYREGFEAGLRADSAQIAFALGLQTGLQIRADTVTGIDAAVFLRGIEAGFAGSAPAYAPDVVERAAAAFRDTLTARRTRAQANDPAVRAQAAQASAAASAAAAIAGPFLAAAAARPGAVVSPTGLVSLVTTPGTGAKPTAASRVSVAYAGRFASGEEFDASPAGQPAEFGLGRVVPGFAEALQDMQVGETRTIWVPAALAYGERGAPGPGGQGGIPPGAALEFDLTLVAILP